VISTLAVAFAPVLVKYLTGGLIYGTTRNILLPASVTTLFSHFQWLLCLISDEIVKRHLLSSVSSVLLLSLFYYLHPFFLLKKNIQLKSYFLKIRATE
jgi:hypothetical protein